jgi:DNA mismatch repair protein MutS
MGNGADTPAMRQYLQMKGEVGEAILLYRMGDFYELFFGDARAAAESIELTLTSRNKEDPEPVPMAGFPQHMLETYVRRLVDQGFQVAIAEQYAAQDERGRPTFDRRIVRIVTPGVPWSSDEIEARESCWIAGLWGRGPVGLAFLDVSTGALRLTEVDDLRLAGQEIERMEAREVVLPQDLHESLRGLLGVADLRGFEAEDLKAAQRAAGGLVSWVRDRARLDPRNVRSLSAYSTGAVMALDDATRRNLELVRPLHGTGRKGTLLGLLDRTCTAMGARLLRDWVLAPLLDLPAIEARLSAVDSLVAPTDAGPLRRALREQLRGVADLERLAGKAAQGTANGRDLSALASSVAQLPRLRDLLQGRPGLAAALAADKVAGLQADVALDVGTWLVDEPPAALTDGGLIRRGVHVELDRLTDMALEGKGHIARIEAIERQRSGISSLKIKHNKVFGYFLEVTQANLHKVPDDWIRKQTLVNAERFITPELKEFEEQVLGADDRRKALEHELFVALRERVGAQVGLLNAVAVGVAWLDVVTALADVAVDRRYARPQLDLSSDLEIVAGRHPVVEASELDDRFVPNDLSLSDSERLCILTGPNMAGKSTIMRQAALIVLMAQMGSFVPADRARIGLCDRVFVRVGASDDLAQGRSTFMVEMSETALILNQATRNSLVLLDEIGRGTSTYDGLAIAWAVAEAIHDDIDARCLYATHYHELVALQDERPRVVNLQVAVSEAGDRIVFLRTLVRGGASKSYGIQCARLAGMPTAVIERARLLLSELERRPRHGPPTRQLSLFLQPDPPMAAAPVAPRAAAPPPPPAAVAPDPLRLAVARLDPDQLTPKAALDALYALRQMLVVLLLVWPGLAGAANLTLVQAFSGVDHTRLLLVGDGPIDNLQSRSSPPVGTAPARATVVLTGVKPGSAGDRRIPVGAGGVRELVVTDLGSATQVTAETERARLVEARVVAPGVVVVDLRMPGRPDDPKLPSNQDLIAWIETVSLSGGSAPQQAEKQRRLVVLDPGHGGWDHGAVGVSGAREADIALEISRRTAEQLRSRLGVDVLLTRDSDVFVGLSERANIANRNNASLFVSIHANSSPYGPTWGTENAGWGVETYSLDTASDAGAARVAARENAVLAERGEEGDALLGALVTAGTNRLSRDLSAMVQGTVVRRLKETYGDAPIRDLGSKTAIFTVLSATRMPAILFESSFVSHPIEEQRLRTAHFQTAIADALTEAIGGWLSRQG